MSIKAKKIAFVVGVFPAVSETFIIDQVAGLLDRGIDVEIFAFRRGGLKGVSARYEKYRMADRTHYLEMPKNRVGRFLGAIPKAIRLLASDRAALGRALDFRKYGNDARSLKYLFWAEPFVGKRFDLVHCHFATIADEFLVIQDILGVRNPIVTTCYGYDVSKVLKEQPQAYGRLKKESEVFLAMSEDMKERMVAHGFPGEKIQVLPVGIEVGEYGFKERARGAGERTEIISIGRFVEKKSFDDLLRALAIVKGRLGDVFRCTIVGDGPLRDKLHALARELGLDDAIDWRGVMPIEKIIPLFGRMHFFVQPSKTASDGDME